MKIICSSILFLLLSGCAILDILYTQEPFPICDKDSVGSEWQGQVCDKYSDGTYQWTENLWRKK